MTVRETLRSLAPVIGERRMLRLWKAYLTADVIERRELENVIPAYAADLLGDTPSSPPAGLFPPPPAEVCAGDIILGEVVYGKGIDVPFGLRTQELLRHGGIYGSSGSGKTNAIALIVDGLMDHGVPFLLIDFKRTFRALLKDYDRVRVFTAGNEQAAPFQFNPLAPPPSADVETWAKKVIAAMSHAYCQGAGSESLLVTALAQAYASAAEAGRYPHLRM